MPRQWPQMQQSNCSASEGVALLEDHDAVNAARPRSQYVFEVVCHLNFPVADVQ